jgi:hypothetical protein
MIGICKNERPIWIINSNNYGYKFGKQHLVRNPPLFATAEPECIPVTAPREKLPREKEGQERGRKKENKRKQEKNRRRREGRDLKVRSLKRTKEKRTKKRWKESTKKD